MRVTAIQRDELVVCTLPEGGEIEITMVCAEGELHRVEPNLNSVPKILENLLEVHSQV